MTVRATRRATGKTVEVEELRHSGRLTGNVRIIHPILKDVGCPWQYDPRRHAYLIPKRHLDDAMARLELAGHVVQYRAAGW